MNQFDKQDADHGMSTVLKMDDLGRCGRPCGGVPRSLEIIDQAIAPVTFRISVFARVARTLAVEHTRAPRRW